MNRFRILLLAVACAPVYAFAQSAPKAQDADAKVPSPAYRSAFADVRPTQEAAATPDKVWLQANRELAAQPGHAMQMDMPKAETSEDPHKGHHQHMKGQ
ncbi:hypothetical protein [Rugamonas aquatica]|uniref:DUF4148 domain-containing protein n=1 Tax=Rugamonas aquatica TaxID=2743357 RepID=A0A6A7MW44_9BURK|nr:hypothetical protein [Rugamonas aquatica]MQA37100.1 hypothetical protein [Rugamonas aquatica]